MYSDKLQLRVAAVPKEIITMHLYPLLFKFSKGILKMARGKSNVVNALSVFSQSLRDSRIGIYRLQQLDIACISNCGKKPSDNGHYPCALLA